MPKNDASTCNSYDAIAKNIKFRQFIITKPSRAHRRITRRSYISCRHAVQKGIHLMSICSTDGHTPHVDKRYRWSYTSCQQAIQVVILLMAICSIDGHTPHIDLQYGWSYTSCRCSTDDHTLHVDMQYREVIHLMSTCNTDSHTPHVDMQYR